MYMYMRISHPKNTSPPLEDPPCGAVGVRRRGILLCETAGTHWRHFTDGSCEANKERFCPQAHRKSHACVHGTEYMLVGLTMAAMDSSLAQQVDTQTILQNYRQTRGSASQLPLTDWNSPRSQTHQPPFIEHVCFVSFWFQVLVLFSFAINLPNVDNKHMPFLWPGPIPGSPQHSLHECD